MGFDYFCSIGVKLKLQATDFKALAGKINSKLSIVEQAGSELPQEAKLPISDSLYKLFYKKWDDTLLKFNSKRIDQKLSGIHLVNYEQVIFNQCMVDIMRCVKPRFHDLSNVIFKVTQCFNNLIKHMQSTMQQKI